MAKQTKQAQTPVAPAPAANAETPEQKAERVKNDRFTRNMKDGKPVVPNGKIPPQAMVIINAVEAAGKAGITRGDLVKNITGVLVTKQPVGRIVSYYQKLVQECGAVTISPN
jgi:hypothetical protein